MLAYLPLLAGFGPSRWLSPGPVAVQASRIGLYAAHFAAGVAFGVERLQGNSACFREPLIRYWRGWTLLAILTAMALIRTALPIWARESLHGIALVSFCAATCFAMCALFLRFGGKPGVVWHSLAVSSYGIYLLHYPVVTWLQFGLLHPFSTAIVKAAITFTCALLLSWGVAILLRRIPRIGRVI